MADFRARLARPQPIILDGATGTELNLRGVDTELPLWSAKALLNPREAEVLKQIHQDYLTAGAEVVTANTFRTHSRNLAEAGLEGRAAELTNLAVELARAAVAEAGLEARVFVAGSLAPLEDCYSPELAPPDEVCLAEHRLMAENLAAAGVDLILVETQNSIREAVAAAGAAAATGLPFGVSFTCRTDGRLYSGESVTRAVEAIQSSGPEFTGINCSPSASLALPLAELARAAPPRLALSAYGNLGHTDDITGWSTTHEVGPTGYCELALGWLADHSPRLKLLGGCCGTGPGHIQVLAEALKMR